MRRIVVPMNVSQHHRAQGQIRGVKMELSASKLPMTLLCAMRDIAMQWRLWWDGSFSPDAPVLRVLWGWQPAEDWTAGFAYVRHEAPGATRVKWTCSRMAIQYHTSQAMIPIGKWHGELTCEPDEEAPIQIALTARPRVYVHKDRDPVTTLPIPTMDTALPRIALP